MMEEEWGPWIEHDGKGCPCEGMMVESVTAGGQAAIHIAGALRVQVHTGQAIRYSGPTSGDAWDWASLAPVAFHLRVIRYRIRKPNALRELIDMVERLPVRDDA
jgi:hypothetical protein